MSNSFQNLFYSPFYSLKSIKVQVFALTFAHAFATSSRARTCPRSFWREWQQPVISIHKDAIILAIMKVGTLRETTRSNNVPGESQNEEHCFVPISPLP